MLYGEKKNKIGSWRKRKKTKRPVDTKKFSRNHMRADEGLLFAETEFWTGQAERKNSTRAMGGCQGTPCPGAF